MSAQTASPAPGRTLDRRLAAVAAGRYTPDDFMIADAKDADMAFGLAAAGPLPGIAEPAEGPDRYRTRADYLHAMRAVAATGDVDVLLTSASNGERLAREGDLDERITLAVRGNDSTDMWLQRGGSYPGRPSRPFRSVDLAEIRDFCDLVLYSVTFTNDADHDLETVQAYATFRREAAAVGMRHFLEVFNPNVPARLSSHEVGSFVNDCIVRTLAGVTAARRPLFLKVAYNGSGALAELVQHDPSLVVGVLGGSAGTTRDTFELLRRAEVSGARIALFGRKIQRAESQPALVRLMRPVLRGELSPPDAVRAYHDALAVAGLTPLRDLTADLAVTDPALLVE